MEKLFTACINNWDSWGKVYQSKTAFAPLARHILQREGLPPAALTGCKPGTNAVFRAGKYILKIFAPEQSGLDTRRDYETELFGLRWAAGHGVAVPGLAAQGTVEDRYLFRYLVLEYIRGVPFGEAVSEKTAAERVRLGRSLRAATDRLNVPCPDMEKADIVSEALENDRWLPFPESFRREHAAFLRALPPEQEVFVHGDLNPDNILLREDGTWAVIDFADARRAPVFYEHAGAACELFRFDKALLQGYFGEYDPVRLAGTCLCGLLMHDFGANIIRDRFGSAERFTSLSQLSQALERRLSSREE